MGITSLLDAPFYTGSAASSGASAAVVPYKYHASLNGHPLMLDVKSDEWRHESIPMVRPAIFQSNQVSEAALSTDGLWRRFQESWHHGAGQVWFDREGSDIYRFRTSKGVDVWTRYQIGLLPATTQSFVSANTNLAITIAGARLYFQDGVAVKYTTDLSTSTTVTSSGSNAKLSLCSDGYTVYFTDGTDVYSTNTATSAAAVYNTLDCAGLAYVKGRLMAYGTGATKNAIYNITSGTPPSALFTHANTDFTWIGFAEGQNAIYAAGFSGDKSLIYRIAVKPDGTALDQPIIAGQLPDGEIIRSIEGYLGTVFLGTDSGWRFCIPDGQGNLNIGPNIATGAAVRCFEGQGNYVWYGLTNYDGTSTGLGRADLTQETVLPKQLAYAPDLMVTAQGNVLSVATFLGLRVLAVSGSGVWAQSTNKVASGTIDSGLITYGNPDTKLAIFLDVRTLVLYGSFLAYLAADDGTFTQIGSGGTAASVGGQFPASETQGQRYEVRFTLSRSGSDTTLGPTLNRWTLKISPTVEDGPAEFIYAPFLLHQTIDTLTNKTERCDVETERDAIKTLRRTSQIVQYAEGVNTYSVIVEDFVWKPIREPGRDGRQNGTLLTKMKVLG